MKEIYFTLFENHVLFFLTMIYLFLIMFCNEKEHQDTWKCFVCVNVKLVSEQLFQWASADISKLGDE